MMICSICSYEVITFYNFKRSSFLGSETDQELQWLGETINACTVLVMNSLGNKMLYVQITAL